MDTRSLSESPQNNLGVPITRARVDWRLNLESLIYRTKILELSIYKLNTWTSALGVVCTCFYHTVCGLGLDSAKPERLSELQPLTVKLD